MMSKCLYFYSGLYNSVTNNDSNINNEEVTVSYKLKKKFSINNDRDYFADEHINSIIVEKTSINSKILMTGRSLVDSAKRGIKSYIIRH